MWGSGGRGTEEGRLPGLNAEGRIGIGLCPTGRAMGIQVQRSHLRGMSRDHKYASSWETVEREAPARRKAN